LRATKTIIVVSHSQAIKSVADVVHEIADGALL
jgi:ABC-type lipoprotein export system ATPase subunit